MLRFLTPTLLLILFGNIAFAEEPPIRYATRGELLYLTRCANCHNAQMHWRDKSIVTNWKGLKSEVRHWQDVSEQGWSKEDIEDVARYLNVTYYKYPWSE